MKSIENIISLFVVLLCLLVSLFNVSYIHLTFIPVGEGSEAWIEDYVVENIDDQINIVVSIGIKNLYDYDKPFTYFIEVFSESNSMGYFFDSIVISSSNIFYSSNSIYLQEIPDYFVIKISNGSDDIYLDIKLKL